MRATVLAAATLGFVGMISVGAQAAPLALSAPVETQSLVVATTSGGVSGRTTRRFFVEKYSNKNGHKDRYSHKSDAGQKRGTGLIILKGFGPKAGQYGFRYRGSVPGANPKPGIIKRQTGPRIIQLR